jgi:hypothetical protein
MSGVKLYIVVWEEPDGTKDYRFMETHMGMKIFASKMMSEGNAILRDGEIVVPMDRAGLTQFLNLLESRIAISFDEVA